MATIEYVEVDDWLNLSATIDEYFTHYNNYIFRGHTDADWKLESTLTRVLNKTYKKLSERQKATAEHIRQFKENIRGRTHLDLNNTTNDEIWALGQHFGLHTPLLDWTRSPYVALFFSLFGPSASKRRALWAILEEDIERINSKNTKKNGKVHVVNPLTHYNDRLVNQRGLFLNIPIKVKLESWIKMGENAEWVTIYKITFPDSIRDDALSSLNNMNINHLSLFPDLNGSSLYTNYQLEAEPYLETMRNAVWK